MSPDWSCTLLVHNRTCCGKYHWYIKPVYNSLVLEAIGLIFHLELRFKSTSLHILQTLKNRHAQAYANVKSVQRGGV